MYLSKNLHLRKNIVFNSKNYALKKNLRKLQNCLLYDRVKFSKAQKMFEF